MRKYHTVFVVIVTTLLLSQGAIFYKFFIDLKHNERMETRLFQAELEFERAIGYGGLIHDFKNYVLRPEESRYYVGVIAHYDKAKALLREIEEIGAPYLGDISLQETYAMLNEYRGRVEGIKARKSFELSARELDQVVRYDDSPALTELDSLSAQVSASIESAFVRESQFALAGSIVVFALCMIALFLNTKYLAIPANRNEHASLPST